MNDDDEDNESSFSLNDDRRNILSKKNSLYSQLLESCVQNALVNYVSARCSSVSECIRIAVTDLYESLLQNTELKNTNGVLYRSYKKGKRDLRSSMSFLFLLYEVILDTKLVCIEYRG